MLYMFVHNNDQSARKRGHEVGHTVAADEFLANVLLSNRPPVRCQRSDVDRYIGTGLQRYHEASVDYLSVYSSMVWMPPIIDPPMVQLTLLIDS